MKKITLIIVAFSSITGIASTLAVGKTTNSKFKFQTIFRYTQPPDIVFTGTRAQAQAHFGCTGTATICAKAYTIGKTHTRVPLQDIFQN